MSDTSPANTQSVVIAGSGTIYIRVQDTDRTRNHRALDTLFVDQLYIRSDNATPPVPPDTPQNLSAVGISSSSIRLNWEPGSTNEQSFDLQRAAAGTANWTALPSPGAGSTSYTDSGLSPATPYDYRIRARNSAGLSGWSDTATGQTIAAANITLSASGYKIKGRHFIDLQWSGATGAVDIFRNGSIRPPAVGGTSFTDATGNKGGATYIYRVCEINSDNCSDDATVIF